MAELEKPKQNKSPEVVRASETLNRLYYGKKDSEGKRGSLRRLSKEEIKEADEAISTLKKNGAL